MTEFGHAAVSWMDPALAGEKLARPLLAGLTGPPTWCSPSAPRASACTDAVVGLELLSDKPVGIGIAHGLAPRAPCCG